MFYITIVGVCHRLFIFIKCLAGCDSGNKQRVCFNINTFNNFSLDVTYGVEDEVLEVTERMIGFTLTVKVEAELDLNPVEIKRGVTQWPTMRESLA